MMVFLLLLLFFLLYPALIVSPNINVDNVSEAQLIAEFSTSSSTSPRVQRVYSSTPSRSGGAFFTGFASAPLPVGNETLAFTNECLSDFSCGGQTDAKVWEVSADGSTVSSMRLGGTLSDVGNAIVLDSALGHIFITGTTETTAMSEKGGCAGGCTCLPSPTKQLFITSIQIPTAKSDNTTGISSGKSTILYTKTCSSLDVNTTVQISSIVDLKIDRIDDEKSIYILGTILRTKQSNRDIGIWKFSLTKGDLQWATKLGSAFADDEAGSLLIGLNKSEDSDGGGIIVSGQTKGFAGECAIEMGCGDNADMILYRLSRKTGKIQWTMQMGGEGYDSAKSMEMTYSIITNSYTLWVSGDTSTPASNRNLPGKENDGYWRQSSYIDRPEMERGEWSKHNSYWRWRGIPFDSPLRMVEEQRREKQAMNKHAWTQMDPTLFDCIKNWKCGLTDFILLRLNLNNTATRVLVSDLTYTVSATKIAKSSNSTLTKYTMPSILGTARWGGAGIDTMSRNDLHIYENSNSTSSLSALLVGTSDFLSFRGRKRGPKISLLPANEGWFNPKLTYIPSLSIAEQQIVQCAPGFQCGGHSDVIVSRVENIDNLNQYVRVDDSFWEKRVDDKNGTFYVKRAGANVVHTKVSYPHTTVWNEPKEFAIRAAQILAQEKQKKEKETVQVKVVSRFGGSLDENAPSMTITNITNIARVWIGTSIVNHHCEYGKTMNGTHPSVCISATDNHRDISSISSAIVAIHVPTKCEAGTAPFQSQIIKYPNILQTTYYAKGSTTVPVTRNHTSCLQCHPGFYSLHGTSCTSCPIGATCTFLLRDTQSGGMIHRGTTAPRALRDFGPTPGANLIKMPYEHGNTTRSFSKRSTTEIYQTIQETKNKTMIISLSFSPCLKDNRGKSHCLGYSQCTKGRSGGQDFLCGYCEKEFAPRYGNCMDCDGGKYVQNRLFLAIFGVSIFLLFPLIASEVLSTYYGRFLCWLILHSIANLFMKPVAFAQWISKIDDRKLDFIFWYGETKDRIERAGGFRQYVKKRIYESYRYRKVQLYAIWNQMKYLFDLIKTSFQAFKSSSTLDRSKVMPVTEEEPKISKGSKRKFSTLEKEGNVSSAFDMLDQGRLHLKGLMPTRNVDELSKEMQLKLVAEMKEEEDSKVVGMFGPKAQSNEKHPELATMQYIRIKRAAPISAAAWEVKAKEQEDQVLVEWARLRMIEEKENEEERERLKEAKDRSRRITMNENENSKDDEEMEEKLIPINDKGTKVKVKVLKSKKKKKAKIMSLEEMIEANAIRAAKAKIARRKALDEVIASNDNPKVDELKGLPGNQDEHRLIGKEITEMQEGNDWITEVVHGSFSNFDLKQEIRRQNFEKEEEKQKEAEDKAKKEKELLEALKLEDPKYDENKRALSPARRKFKEALARQARIKLFKQEHGEDAVYESQSSEEEPVNTPQEVFRRMALKKLAARKKRKVTILDKEEKKKKKKALREEKRKNDLEEVRKNTAKRLRDWEETKRMEEQKTAMPIQTQTLVAEEAKVKKKVLPILQNPFEAALQAKRRSKTAVGEYSGPGASRQLGRGHAVATSVKVKIGLVGKMKLREELEKAKEEEERKTTNSVKEENLGEKNVVSLKDVNHVEEAKVRVKVKPKPGKKKAKIAVKKETFFPPEQKESKTVVTVKKKPVKKRIFTPHPVARCKHGNGKDCAMCIKEQREKDKVSPKRVRRDLKSTKTKMNLSRRLRGGKTKRPDGKLELTSSSDESEHGNDDVQAFTSKRKQETNSGLISQIDNLLALSSDDGNSDWGSTTTEEEEEEVREKFPSLKDKDDEPQQQSVDDFWSVVKSKEDRKETGNVERIEKIGKTPTVDDFWSVVKSKEDRKETENVERIEKVGKTPTSNALKKKDEKKRLRKFTKRDIMLRKLAGQLLTTNVEKVERTEEIQVEQKKMPGLTIEPITFENQDLENFQTMTKESRKHFHETLSKEVLAWLHDIGLSTVEVENQLATLLTPSKRKNRRKAVTPESSSKALKNQVTLEMIANMTRPEIVRLQLSDKQRTLFSRSQLLLKRRYDSSSGECLWAPSLKRRNEAQHFSKLSSELLDWISISGLEGIGLEKQLAVLFSTLSAKQQKKRQIDQLLSLTAEQRSRLDLDLTQKGRFMKAFDELKHATQVSKTMAKTRGENYTGWALLERNVPVFPRKSLQFRASQEFQLSTEMMKKQAEEASSPRVSLRSPLPQRPQNNRGEKKIQSFFSEDIDEDQEEQHGIKLSSWFETHEAFDSRASSFAITPSQRKLLLTPSPKRSRKTKTDMEMIDEEKKDEKPKKKKRKTKKSQRNRTSEISRIASSLARSGTEAMMARKTKMKEALAKRAEEKKTNALHVIDLEQGEEKDDENAIVEESISNSKPFFSNFLKGKSILQTKSSRFYRRSKERYKSCHAYLIRKARKVASIADRGSKAEMKMENEPSKELYTVRKIALHNQVKAAQRKAGNEAVALIQIVWFHAQCLSSLIHLHEIPWPDMFFNFLVYLDGMVDLPSSPISAMVSCGSGNGELLYGVILFICSLLLLVPPFVVVLGWKFWEWHLNDLRVYHERKLLRQEIEKQYEEDDSWPFPEQHTGPVMRYLNPDGPARSRPGACDFKAEDERIQQRRLEKRRKIAMIKASGQIGNQKGYEVDIKVKVRDRYVLRILERSKKCQDLALGSSVLLVMLLWLPTCRFILEAFDCRSMEQLKEDSTSEISKILLLRSDNRIVCYGSSHTLAIVAAIFLLPIACYSVPFAQKILQERKVPFFEGEQYKEKWRLYVPRLESVRQILVAVLVQSVTIGIPLSFTVFIQSCSIFFLLYYKPFKTESVWLSKAQISVIFGQLNASLLGCACQYNTNGSGFQNCSIFIILFNASTMILLLCGAIYRGQFARSNSLIIANKLHEKEETELRTKRSLANKEYKKLRKKEKERAQSAFWANRRMRRLQVLFQRSLGKRPVTSEGQQTGGKGFELGDLLSMEKRILRRGIVERASTKAMLLGSISKGKKKYDDLYQQAKDHARENVEIRSMFAGARANLRSASEKSRSEIAAITKANLTPLDEWQGEKGLTWEGLEADKFGYKAEDCTLDPDAAPLAKATEDALPNTEEKALEKRKIGEPTLGTLGCKHGVSFGTCMACQAEAAAALKIERDLAKGKTLMEKYASMVSGKQREPILGPCEIDPRPKTTEELFKRPR
eukprot:g2808.t1